MHVSVVKRYMQTLFAHPALWVLTQTSNGQRRVLQKMPLVVFAHLSPAWTVATLRSPVV